MPSLIHSCPITCAGFHALLNSLFKVLFNFPSWYLFAIGIVLYLAFDGVYHRIWTAFSNNPTRGTPPGQTVLFERALHPLWDKCHNHVDFKHHSKPSEANHTPHFLSKSTVGFGFGLLPFRSPLLRESLLISFPPLIDMLKFSG